MIDKVGLVRVDGRLYKKCIFTDGYFIMIPVRDLNLEEKEFVNKIMDMEINLHGLQ